MRAVRYESRWLMFVVTVVVPMVGLGVIGLFVGPPPILTSEVLFLALGIVISLELRTSIRLWEESRTDIAVRVGESELVPLYEDIKTHAVSECVLSWSNRYKTTDTETYFQDERAFLRNHPEVSFRRLVGTTETGLSRRGLLDHMVASKDLAGLNKSGKPRYECRETHLQGVELVWADTARGTEVIHRALLILAQGDEKIGLYFEDRKLPGQDSEQSAVHRLTASAVKALFESEWTVSRTESDLRAQLGVSNSEGPIGEVAT